MAQLRKDTVERLSELQVQLWSVVGQTVSESAGVPIAFVNPLTTTAKPGDLQADANASQLTIQFALASTPDSYQTVMIRPDTVLNLAALVTGVEPAEEVDENILADVRPIAESIVQGLCLAIGRLLGETIVATSLNIRYQSFSYTPNLQRAVEIVRTGIAIEADGFSGTITWVYDADAAGLILKEVPDEESTSAASPFASPFPSFGANPPPGQNEVNKLDILLDVPLEISVELGRVRMTVREVVDLGTGSIVEVDKAAGEPVDVMVNGRLVARGEVVVIEDNFGVRITEILDPNARLARLEAA